MYSIKEAFYTLQGEGAQSGRASVFCRFSGCNLWSGREQDRTISACRFCDTDFVGIDGPGGGRFANAEQLALHLVSLWPNVHRGQPFVVFTGGEPLLQLDTVLIEAMHEQNFEVGVETNGTVRPPAGIDWLCVSPKGNATLLIEQGNELKLVYPQPDAPPERFEHLNFQHFFLQPMDTSPQGELLNTAAEVVDYCLKKPQWRVSLQTHKLLGIA